MCEHPFIERFFSNPSRRQPGRPAGPLGAAALAGALLAAACGGSGSGADTTARNAPTYAVGGQVAGLDEGFVELRNGLDRKRVDANADGLGLDATFRFDAALPAGATYDVRIANDPMAQFALQCDVVNGRGTVGTAPVNNILVRCARVKSLRLLAGVPIGPSTQDGLADRVNFGSIGGLARDAAGNVFVATRTAIRRITPLGIVTTIAGSMAAAGTNDGTASEARFSALRGLVADSAGNLLAVDGGAIRRVTASGVTTTLAGRSGQPGSADGAGTAARFGTEGQLAIDAAGNAYLTDTNNHTVRRISAAGAVTTVAGTTGIPGSTDGTGAAARFNLPGGIALDRDGTLIVADTGSHTIRRVTPGGTVTTIAGSVGNFGAADGPALAATFNSPAGVAIDSAGNAYIASSTTIRRLTPAGVVSTFAGTDGPGASIDGTGVAARFSGPSALVFGSDGILYAIDTNFEDSLVRRIGPEAQVSTFAGLVQSRTVDGTGIDARFGFARGVAVDGVGNVYVADRITVRRVSPLGVVTTIAGSDDGGAPVDGTGAAARFSFLQAIACDASGNVFVTDRHAIRRITPSGTVTTLAGSVELAGSVNGTGGAARFRAPRGLAVDAAGNLYVADTGNYAIRRVTPAGVVTTVAGGSQGTDDGIGAAAKFNFANFTFIAGGIGVAVDANGVVFVADTSALRRITAGGVVTTVATPPIGSQTGIAVLPNGSIYVSSTGSGIVQLLLPDGAGGYRAPETVAGSLNVTTTALGPLPATIGEPQALAVFGKRVYVAAGSAVVFFDR